MSQNKTYVIIPAGGQSRRLGGDLPKQYHTINGKELIAYTLSVFQNSPLCDGIIVSAQSCYFSLLNDIRIRYSFSKMRPPVEGGTERQDSVFNALNSISAQPEDLIAVHDAARPLLDEMHLSSVLDAARASGAAILALSARDTLLKGENNTVSSYLDRREIFYAQTPQVFRYSVLKDAMDRAAAEGFYGTDESMLVRRTGRAVDIVEGSQYNFKVTTQEDIEILKKITGMPGTL
ncbi:MAG: 2-C-methyl-D-erythritol 4-phosphate cytidylyltransferase [Bacteroidota bacterium]